MSPQPFAMPPGRIASKSLLLALALACSAFSGCSDDDANQPATNTGQSCTSASQCYPGVTAGELLGDAVCLDKVPDGYCTHHCTTDSDCCAATGECNANLAEVCSPFESTDALYCLLSCEDTDLSAKKLTDPDLYCQTYAGPAFGCRSSGGGSQNRKVCMP